MCSPDGRYCHRVELVRRARVHRHADAARFGVDAERRLQQMVESLGDLDVEPGVGVLQDDLLQKARAGRPTQLTLGHGATRGTGQLAL